MLMQPEWNDTDNKGRLLRSRDKEWTSNDLVTPDLWGLDLFIAIVFITGLSRRLTNTMQKD